MSDLLSFGRLLRQYRRARDLTWEEPARHTALMSAAAAVAHASEQDRAAVPRPVVVANRALIRRHDLLRLAPAGRHEEEFVDLLDHLLSEREVTFGGRYWRAHEATTHPGCVQHPRLPFAVAATAARLAGESQGTADRVTAHLAVSRATWM